VSEINYLIKSGAEKVVGDHQNFPQFLSGFYDYYFNFSEISRDKFPIKTFCLLAFPAFCRADKLAKTYGISLCDFQTYMPYPIYRQIY